MEPPSTYTITIKNETSFRISSTAIRNVAKKVLTSTFLPSGSLSILLTDDTVIKRLNQQFRGLSSTTDVLTFPAAPMPYVPGIRQSLGDIAISVDHARRQAVARGVSLAEEVAFLLIHGILHLAGQDDESEEDRDQMISAMNSIAKSLGFAEDWNWATLSVEEARL